jgi:predicted alpha/beta superfamily hydrolase
MAWCALFGQAHAVDVPYVVTSYNAGTLYDWPVFPAHALSPRHVWVWIPRQAPNNHTPMQVLYMHDGQNIFDGKDSITHHGWQVDQHLSRLIAKGLIPPTLVVGIASSSQRWLDYAPQAPLETATAAQLMLAHGSVDHPQSDAYVNFLVDQLKPYIDAHFNTYTDAQHTAIMGSSMGGLISLYAYIKHPEIFGRVGALSSHWTLSTEFKRYGSTPSEMDPALREFATSFTQWFADQWPQAQSHRLWIDRGTLELDSFYADFLPMAQASLLSKGYHLGEQMQIKVYEGATHNELSWDQRLDDPLIFLLRESNASASAVSGSQVTSYGLK